MPLNVGDAVLDVLANTSQFDEVLASLPGRTDAAMTAAAASVEKVGAAFTKLDFELDATGSNVPYAGDTIKQAMERSAASVKTLGQQMIESGKAGTTLADAFRLVEAPAVQSDAALQNMAFALRGVPGSTKEAAQGMKELSEHTHHAIGAAGLFGEAFGIRLPKHVRSFLAEIPAVGKALDTAFSAIAIYFLIEGVVKAGEKLGEFIGHTFIYTEEMKKMDAASAKFNQELVKIAEGTKKANDELEKYGMTAAQKTQLAMTQNNAAFVDNTAAIATNTAKRADLRREQDDLISQTPGFLERLDNTTAHWLSLGRVTDEHTKKMSENQGAMRNLEGEFTVLSQKQKELTVEYAVLNLQLRDQEDAARQQTLTKQNAFEQAKIKGAQVVGTALLQLQKAQADAEAAQDDQSGAKRILINAAYNAALYQREVADHQQRHAEAVRFENETYQLQLANLQNRATLEKTMGPAGVIAAKATEEQILQLTKAHNLTLQQEQVSSNSTIEALIKTHEAKVAESYADMMARVKSTVKSSLDALVSSDAGWDKFSKDAIKAATDVENAFDSLGVTSVGRLTKALNDAQNAYSILHKSGMVSAHDLAVANLAVLNTQLQLNRAMGDTNAVRATEKEIEKLSKDLGIFEGEINKTKGFWDSFSADFKKKAHEDGTAGQQMGRLIGDSMKGMQQAFESSIAAAITGEETFGAALAQATSQILAQLAAQAAVKAIYFTAMGIAELAGGFTAGTAAEWFHAAAMMAIVAGSAGGAAAGLSGGGKGAAGGGTNKANIDQTATSNKPVGTTAPSANVPRLFSGAIVESPTHAIIGDNGRGGSQVEGVFPLGDPRAFQAVQRLFGGSGGGTQNHYYLDGFRFSASDMSKLTRQLTRAAQTGRARVTVATASRVTRRG